MNDASFGLKEGDLAAIIEVLSSAASLKKAVIFGSRAKGNYKQGSDVDIALFTPDKNLASHIAFLLNEETLMPYHFDVLDYYTITNQELKDHIDRVGIVFYKKD